MFNVDISILAIGRYLHLLSNRAKKVDVAVLLMHFYEIYEAYEIKHGEISDVKL